MEADGRFDLALFLGGPVRLVTWIDDMPGYVGGADYASATVFDLAPGDHLTGVSRVESGLDIDVLGLSPFDGRFRVNVFDAAGRDLTRRPDGYSGFTAYRSPLRICNLPAGEIFLSLTPLDDRAHWLSQFYDRRDSLAVADPITVPPDGQVGQATVTLVTGGRIRGRLFGPDGEPADGWVVLRVYAAAEPNTILMDLNAWDVSYDRDTGDYAINQLRDGDYKVRGRIHDGPWRYWPGVVTFEEAGVVTIADLGEVTGIDLILP